MSKINDIDIIPCAPSKDKEEERKNQVFDYENTWKINYDFIANIISQNNLPLEDEQKQDLLKKIEQTKSIYERKKKLLEEKTSLRGKLLMDKQILEESRRRNEENSAYFEEQMSEISENIEKKESFIHQFDKKFKEVEIYVQRQSKHYKKVNTPNPYVEFINFNITQFIQNNEDLCKDKIKIRKNIYHIKNHVYDIQNDNVKLEHKDNSKEKSEEIDSKFITTNETSKIHEVVDKYNNIIKLMQTKNEELENKILKCNNNLFKLGTLGSKPLTKETQVKYSPLWKPRKLTDFNLIDDVEKSGFYRPVFNLSTVDELDISSIEKDN